jgi:folylpolyglutamate synthase/dihydropteroate synthase
MTGVVVEAVWFEHHKTQMFVTQHGLGGRLDLSAR